MSLRQGPRHLAPAPAHEPHRNSRPTVFQLVVWDREWWSEPANVELVRAAVAAISASGASGVKVDRARHLAHVLTEWTSTREFTVTLSVQRLAGLMATSEDIVKIHLRVLRTAGVLVEVRPPIKWSQDKPGRTAHRRLTYLLEAHQRDSRTDIDGISEGNPPNIGETVTDPLPIAITKPPHGARGEQGDGLAVLTESALDRIMAHKVNQGGVKNEPALRASIKSKVAECARQAIQRWPRVPPAADALARYATAKYLREQVSNALVQDLEELSQR